MGHTEQYTIWLKPVGPGHDINRMIARLAALEHVVSVSATNIDASGITKREAVFAVALSVTANFATDGLKTIFAHFEQDETARVVLCRRSDGSDVPVNLDSTGD